MEIKNGFIRTSIDDWININSITRFYVTSFDCKSWFIYCNTPDGRFLISSRFDTIEEAQKTLDEDICEMGGGI